MPRFSFKAVALASALSIAALAATYEPADAGGRHHRHHHRGGGGVAAAAIAGLAIGAIIGGAASRRSEPSYYYAAPPPPPRYYAPPPVAYYSPQPWSPEWYDYCSRRYVSFDPRSGTYQPHHGPRRFCQ